MVTLMQQRLAAKIPDAATTTLGGAPLLATKVSEVELLPIRPAH